MAGPVQVQRSPTEAPSSGKVVATAILWSPQILKSTSDRSWYFGAVVAAVTPGAAPVHPSQLAGNSEFKSSPHRMSVAETRPLVGAEAVQPLFQFHLGNRATVSTSLEDMN